MLPSLLCLAYFWSPFGVGNLPASSCILDVIHSHQQASPLMKHDVDDLIGDLSINFLAPKNLLHKIYIEGASVEFPSSYFTENIAGLSR